MGLFGLFFLWARSSQVGAGALRGAVAADAFTWIVFAFLDFPFRRFRVTLGGAFELLLVVAYFNRGAWFAIETDLEATALSALFFFLFVTVKAGIWAVERVLDVTGVAEPSSP